MLKILFTLKTTGPQQNVFKITDTLVLLSLGDVQLGTGGKHRTHHLKVKALRISQRLLQVPPLGSRERPVRRLHLPCKTFRLQ